MILVGQIREQLWNITIQSADIAYTDALEFYSSVREASKRRVDAAETLFAALSPFFKRHRGETEEPTEKQALRDFKALEHGKHDGKLIIENIRPKMTGPMVEAKKGFSPIENAKSLTRHSETPPNSKKAKKRNSVSSEK